VAHEVLVLRANGAGLRFEHGETDDSRSPGGHGGVFARRIESASVRGGIENVSIEIVYETHATSVHNEHGIGSGWLDGELSERGRREAEELGRRRSGDDIAAVYTSDLGRAVETAEIAFGGSGISIHHDRSLRECNYGELNGQPLSRFSGEPPRRIDTPYPDGESYRQVVERVRRFLDGLPMDLNGSRIVVIGHAATRWSLEHVLEGRPLEELVGEPFEWQPGWEYVLRR
jgi:alpha-ribazole phosphatase/probable phosphoglycerate mutase